VQVYEVFSKLALAARSSTYCFGSSIADELFMIIRKQVFSVLFSFILLFLSPFSCLQISSGLYPCSLGCHDSYWIGQPSRYEVQEDGPNRDSESSLLSRRHK
jgi:hypothetical protein